MALTIGAALMYALFVGSILDETVFEGKLKDLFGSLIGKPDEKAIESARKQLTQQQEWMGTQQEAQLQLLDFQKKQNAELIEEAEGIRLQEREDTFALNRMQLESQERMQEDMSRTAALGGIGQTMAATALTPINTDISLQPMQTFNPQFPMLSSMM